MKKDNTIQKQSKFNDIFVWTLFCISTLAFFGVCWTLFYQNYQAHSEFERETWLNIEQLEEKYHVHRSAIYEKYLEMKFDLQNNNQTLEEELFNALTKHQ